MKKIVYLLSVLFILSFFSCKNDNESYDYDQNISAAKNSIMTIDIFNDLFRILHQSFYDTILKNNGYMKIFGADMSYYEFPSGDSISIIVNYPDWDFLCPDGLYRRGDCIVRVYTPFSDTTGDAYIYFEGFAVEDNILSGDFTIKLEDDPANGNINYKATTGDISILRYESSGTVKWTYECTFVWTTGMDTPQDFTDDNFLVEGTATGISTYDIDFNMSITDGIVMDTSCIWFKGGNMDIITPDIKCNSGSVSFESDICSGLFEMNFDGIIFKEQFLFTYRPPLE